MQPHRLQFPLIAALAFLPGTFLFSQATPAPQTTPKLAFSAPKAVNVPATYAGSSIVGTGDLNGDDKTDLLTSAGLLLGDGKGGFTPSSIDESALLGSGSIVLPLMDLDGDGKLDALQFIPEVTDPNHCDDPSGGDLTLFAGDGHGGFVPKQSGLGYSAGDYNSIIATVGDFNHDGKPDVAYIAGTDGCDPNYVQSLQVYLNQGNGTFRLAGQYVQDADVAADGRGLVAGDFNGDGKLDLAYTVTAPDAYFNNYIQVQYGNGDGSLRTGPIYTLDSFGYLEAATDFNGDKRADLLVSVEAKNVKGAQPRIATLLAKANGGFYWSSAVTVPSQDSFFSTGQQGVWQLVDLNGDGKLDLPLSYYKAANGTTYLKILAGVGGGRFSAPQRFVTFPSPVFVTALPLTKGARPSILFQSTPNNGGNSKLGLLLNESK